MSARLLFAVLLLWSCGDSADGADATPPLNEDAGVAEAGTADAGFTYDLTPIPPEDPAPPIEPSLAPCPPGWRTIAREGPDLCDPWPASGRATCGPGEAHFPGTPGCSLLGDACPPGEFVDLGAAAIYVTASTTAAGGDGTIALPLTSIAQAINLASPGTTIVLGRGTFDESFFLDRALTLFGSCVAETRLTSSAALIDAAVITVAAAVEISNLTVSGERIGVLVESGRLTGHDLAVDGATQIGLRVRGGEAILSDLVVRGTRAAPADGLGNGHGIAARGGGRIEASRVVVENNREIGIALRDPVTAPHRFTDVAVISTQLQAPFDTGRGLNVAEQTRARFERAIFEDNHDVSIALSFSADLELIDAVIRDSRVNSAGLFGVGMAVNANSHASGQRVFIGNSATTGLAVGSDPDEQSSVDFTDLVIEETNGDDAGNFGRGLEVGYGADARLERVWVKRSQLHGIFADEAGSTITATDAFALETRPRRADGDFGWGLSVTRGASLELTRAEVSRNSSMGGGFSDEGTYVRLLDLTLEDTAPGQVVGPCGRGLNAQEGVELIIERARVSRNREVGIVAHDPTTRVRLTDIRIEDTSTVGIGNLGTGLGAQLGAQLSMTRGVISESRECGAFAHDSGTLMELTEVAISNGMGTPQFGTFGRGLNVQTGGAAVGRRILLQDNREGAIVVANAGSTFTGTEIAVKRTRQRLCAATSCPNEGAGNGVVVRDSGSVELSAFLVAENFVTGAQISEGATIDLSDGDVVAHPVGVNVQTAGFDNNRVLTNVRYIDNAVQVNAATLFVPDNEVSPIPE